MFTRAGYLWLNVAVDSIGREIRVPTLFRLLISVGLLVALVYGAMLAIVTFVHPEQHEIVQGIALPKPRR